MQTVVINGKEYGMKATALIPRLYRFHFGRDIIQDMRKLQKSYQRVSELKKKEDLTPEEEQDAQLDVMDLTIFENVAWLMIKACNDEIPDTPDAWLDSIDGVFSVYEVLPLILKEWANGQKTTSVPKKQ